MSYCRFSSDDYQCDVYVYQDGNGGWTTHVAGSRYLFKEPLPAPAMFSSADNFKIELERHQTVMAINRSHKPMKRVRLSRPLPFRS